MDPTLKIPEQTRKRLEKGKALGGRPSKYNPEIITKTEEYLETYEEKGDVIPTLASLALTLDISKETIDQWIQDKNKSKFSGLICKLKLIQEQKLVSGGLESRLNPSITKLVLSKHGYSDNPNSNQGDTGIHVTVNRGTVSVKAGNQTLTVSDQDEERTIDIAAQVIEDKEHTK